MGKFLSYTLLFLACWCFTVKLSGQIHANAGADKSICPGTITTIGGNPTASGGFPPYTYSWSPATGLSSPAVSNPTVTVSSSITYTLTIKDVRDSTDTDIITITLDDIRLMNAGADGSICLRDNQSVTLGGAGNYAVPYTFLWQPVTGLSNNTDPRPIATPTTTTAYTLLITSPSCGVKTDQVVVYVHDLEISAGADTIMLDGETIQLHASPYDTSFVYWWWNTNNQTVTYPTTHNPDVSPKDTTTFYLSVKDQYGCIYYDSVRVYVLNNTSLYFYNSLTPNGDGENDVWVIGNLEKYPSNKLQIFNRYGQEIYSVTDYKNDWSGKYLGQDLPGGTYYYIFDTKTEKGKFKGSITIYR